MTKLFSNRMRVSFSGVLCVIGVTAVSSGCSVNSDETVKPRLDVINQTKSALSGTDITSITGTYGSTCTGHSSGTDTWTLSASGGPASDELIVRKNDPSCVLTVADIATASGPFVGSPAIPLNAAGTYQPTASAFALDSQPLAFYGNAKISAIDFATDFTITVLVSDAPSASDQGDKNASYLTQAGSISTGTVPASDYTITFGSLVINEDATNTVLSVSGYAQLAEQSVAGQDYAIYNGALTSSSTLSEVETAYNGASAAGHLADLTTLQLPATSFGLVSADLDTTTPRTVIIRNTASGVSSYQLLLVTFKP